MLKVISMLMIAIGWGMIFILTRDIFKSEEIDRSGGIFKSRNKDSGDLMLLHWIAEYLTSIGLIVSGIGILITWNPAEMLAPVFLGALAYSAMNSLSWALAKKDRFVYAIPIFFSFITSIASILVVFNLNVS